MALLAMNAHRLRTFLTMLGIIIGIASVVSVVALGEGLGTASQTVDAQGLVVAPGFVDIHTHYDAQVLWDPELSISPWHGVTTAVLGNCGFGVAPTRPEHRDLILRTLERVEGMTFSMPNSVTISCTVF
jgi:N-acyl-D-aspartate/D-glutamate deacylase